MVLVSEVQVSFPDLAALFGALPENISVVLYVCVLVRVYVCVGGCARTRMCTLACVHGVRGQCQMTFSFVLCRVQS